MRPPVTQIIQLFKVSIYSQIKFIQFQFNVVLFFKIGYINIVLSKMPPTFPWEYGLTIPGVILEFDIFRPIVVPVLSSLQIILVLFLGLHTKISTYPPILTRSINFKILVNQNIAI